MDHVDGICTSWIMWIEYALHGSCGWNLHFMDHVDGICTSWIMWMEYLVHGSCGWNIYIMDRIYLRTSRLNFLTEWCGMGSRAWRGAERVWNGKKIICEEIKKNFYLFLGWRRGGGGSKWGPDTGFAWSGEVKIAPPAASMHFLTSSYQQIYYGFPVNHSLCCQHNM